MKRLSPVAVIVSFVLGLLAAPPASAAQQAPASHAMAAYWAPVIVHDFSPMLTPHDYLTRFDYDGDWRASNNRQNAMRVEMPAYVYSWVQETPSHYFLGYALYHVAGKGARGPYENELSGVVVAVEKSSDPETPMGRFVALLTPADGGFRANLEEDSSAILSDDKFRADLEEEDSSAILSDDAKAALEALWRSHTAPSRSLKRTGPAESGHDVDFVLDQRGFHPVIYVTAESHRIATTPAGGTAGRPSLFEGNGVTDWRTRQGRYPSSKEGLYKGPLQFGVVYAYEARAGLAAPKGMRGRGTRLHHWQVVGYDLLSIRPLWERRDDHREGGLTFEADGILAGGGPRGPHTRAPWAWGPVFLSPGRVLREQLEGLDELREEPIGCSFAPLEEVMQFVKEGRAR